MGAAVVSGIRNLRELGATTAYPSSAMADIDDVHSNDNT